jgi:chaperone required for assembly of F1-ATPase
MTDSETKPGLAPPATPRRFYTEAGVRPEGEGWTVTLDGRPVRTPRKLPLILPRQAVAQAVAAEWAAQGQAIVPALMPMMTLASTAIDIVAANPGPAIAEIVAYAGSDLVCYRAEGPASLVVRQAAAWNPLVAWVEAQTGERLVISEGIIHHPQAPALLVRVEAMLAALDPLTLTAVHSLTTLTGSAVLALAVMGRQIGEDDAWAAAHVDETWQAEQWGEDAEAKARLDARRRVFAAACLLIRLLHE